MRCSTMQFGRHAPKFQINLLPGRPQHWTQRKQAPPKRWYPSTKPYDVMPKRPCKQLEKNVHWKYSTNLTHLLLVVPTLRSFTEITWDKIYIGGGGLNIQSRLELLPATGTSDESDNTCTRYLLTSTQIAHLKIQVSYYGLWEKKSM